ncbi:MAG TPA: glycoside hydrolase, partial [Verrucomicrobiae bacterium]|nr:glycoside hydrolase [Verrucomicrobiae bacterium]
MFKSFFSAGFECATGYNAGGEWIDQIVATQHDKHVEEDYRRLREVGIRTVREGIRWPYVDFRGHYDFSSVTPFLKAAWNHGTEVIWDLFHYGYPEDLDIFSDEFRKRFADYCHAVAHYIRSHQEGPYYFTPVNEPSYLSWAGGDKRRFAPHCKGRAGELKIALARAGIEGINAIRAVIPEARMVNVDPICRVALPKEHPEIAAEVERYNEFAIFESWDLLCGKVMPELGGSREHLDIVGMNYYWTNQWELGRDEHPLAPDDERLSPLRDLVRTVWQRYGGDILITETGHVSDMRASWLNYVTEEALALLEEDVPLRGICLYPILGMPEWHTRHQWTPMGLWDLENHDSKLHRKIHQPMAEVLRTAQQKLNAAKSIKPVAA